MANPLLNLGHIRSRPPQVAVALDYGDLDDALRLADLLRPITSWFKVGCQLFARYGRKAVDTLNDRGCDIFVDLKVNGTPQTDLALARAITKWRVKLVDIHLTLGRQGVTKFVEGIDRESADRPCIVGVTLLTSYADVCHFGSAETRRDIVVRLAERGRELRLDGVVCAVADVPSIREAVGDDALVVTPGIRPLGSQRHEQRQVATPSAAVKAGADLLVVGRPITRAARPPEALEQILQEVRSTFYAQHRAASTGAHVAIGSCFASEM